jgi:hypothetical protein
MAVSTFCKAALDEKVKEYEDKQREVRTEFSTSVDAVVGQILEAVKLCFNDVPIGMLRYGHSVDMFRFDDDGRMLIISNEQETIFHTEDKNQICLECAQGLAIKLLRASGFVIEYIFPTIDPALKTVFEWFYIENAHFGLQTEAEKCRYENFNKPHWIITYLA